MCETFKTILPQMMNPFEPNFVLALPMTVLTNVYLLAFRNFNFLKEGSHLASLPSNNLCHSMYSLLETMFSVQCSFFKKISNI